MTRYYNYRVTDPQAVYPAVEVLARHHREAREKGLARMHGCPLHEVAQPHRQDCLARLQLECLGEYQPQPHQPLDQEYVVLMPEGSTLGGRPNLQMRVITGHTSGGGDGFLVVTDRSLEEQAQQFGARYVTVPGPAGPREFFVLLDGTSDQQLAAALADYGDTPRDCWEVWQQPLEFHVPLRGVVCW